MSKNVETLKIQKNGTMKLAREYTLATIGTGKPGRVGEINATSNEIVLATGVTSSLFKGLIVEETTATEDQNKISILADEAEVNVHNDSLESGVQFVNGSPVYHNAASDLTPTSGTGNRMGTSLASMFSNSGSELAMITRAAEDVAND